MNACRDRFLSTNYRPLFEQLTTWPLQRVSLHVKYHVSLEPLQRTVAVLPSSVTVLPAGATNFRHPRTATYVTSTACSRKPTSSDELQLVRYMKEDKSIKTNPVRSNINITDVHVCMHNTLSPKWMCSESCDLFKFWKISDRPLISC